LRSTAEEESAATRLHPQELLSLRPVSEPDGCVVRRGQGATCAFGAVYLYTSELYPTTLRTVGVGVSSMSARLGAIVSPYIAAFGSTSVWIPMAVFGGCTIISGFLVLFLPETLGKDLPATIEEALRLGDGALVEEVAVLGVDGRQESEESEESHEATPLIS
jgi:MFS family permease